VALPFFLVLGVAVHPAPAADEPLDVGDRAGVGEGQQPLLGLRRRDPGQRADLGVGQLAAGQGRSDAREAGQRPGHPYAFARGAKIHADPPGQPVGARAGALLTPAASGIEITDEVEQSGARHLDVGRQQGDLVTQPVERFKVRAGARLQRRAAPVSASVVRAPLQ
jgi:hypothetical protein